MSPEQRFCNEMCSFRFLNERELFKILYQFYYPKVLIVTFSNDIIGLFEINGDFFMELPGSAGYSYKADNGILNCSDFVVCKPGMYRYFKKIVLQVDLLAKTYKNVDIPLERQKPNKKELNIELKIKNVSTLITLTKHKNKTIDVQGTPLSISVSQNFYRVQFSNLMILINKQNSEFIEIPGHWTNSAPNDEEDSKYPDVYVSFLRSELLHVDSEMRKTTYLPPGNVCDVISTE